MLIPIAQPDVYLNPLNFIYDELLGSRHLCCPVDLLRTAFILIYLRGDVLRLANFSSDRLLVIAQFPRYPVKQQPAPGTDTLPPAHRPPDTSMGPRLSSA